MTSPTFLAMDIFAPYWSLVLLGFLEKDDWEDPVDEHIWQHAESLSQQRTEFLFAVKRWTGLDDAVMSLADERSPWGAKGGSDFSKEAIIADFCMMLGRWDTEVESGVPPSSAKLGEAAANEAQKLVSATSAAVYVGGVSVEDATVAIREILQRALELLPKKLADRVQGEIVIIEALRRTQEKEPLVPDYGPWVSGVIERL